jgi:hypothetical protein
MESTGVRGKIQISSDCRELLKAAGKELWTKPREEKVIAKGKGKGSHKCPFFNLILGLDAAHFFLFR